MLVVGVLPTVAMVLLEGCVKALSVQTAALGAAYTLEVHHTVARVSLGTPGVARLEDPAFADELQAVQDEEAPTPGAAPGSCWSPSATCASPSSPCA